MTIPLLAAAAVRAPRCPAVFVLDERLLRPAAPARRIFPYRSLQDQPDGRLLIVAGDPAAGLPELAAKAGATSVLLSADCAQYGRNRDHTVRAALAERGIELVTPGRERKQDGEPFRVFTPFYRASRRYSWRAPADTGKSTVEWVVAGVLAKDLHLPVVARGAALHAEAGRRRPGVQPLNWQRVAGCDEALRRYGAVAN